MSDERLYGLEDSDRLFNEMEDLLEYHLDDCGREELPATVTVYEFRRMAVKVDWNHALEVIYERLDEEYGNPDGDYTENYPAPVVDAAKVLATAIELTYEPWACEPTGGTQEIDAIEWWEGINGQEADHE